jgi:hypothetical protein
MRRIFIILLVLISLKGFCNNPLNNDEIIYLSNMRIYFCDVNHKNTIRLINTNDKILDFSISPDNKYLAYSKFIKRDIYNYDSDSIKNGICSIVIYDLELNKIIGTFIPQQDEKLLIDFWTKSMHLICDVKYEPNDYYDKPKGDYWYDIRIFSKYDVLQYETFVGKLDSLRNINNSFVDLNNKRTLIANNRFLINSKQYFYFQKENIYLYNLDTKLSVLFLKNVIKSMIIKN